MLPPDLPPDAQLLAANVRRLPVVRAAIDALDAEPPLGAGRPADAFRDDRLAQARDHRFEAGTDEVFTAVVMHQVHRPDFPREPVLHTDTTSQVLDGAHEDREPDPRAPVPARATRRTSGPMPSSWSTGSRSRAGREFPCEVRR